MISGIVPLDSCRTKFYRRERDSKRFLDLSEEDLVLLSKKVYRKEEIMEDTLLGRVKKMSNLERYQKTLQYLTSPLIGLEFKTFDERIAFLIMMVDPNLITFKEFLKLDLISLEEIDKIDDKKENQNNKNYETEYDSYTNKKINEFNSKYDLTTINGIMSIPITEAQKYSDGGESVVYMPNKYLVEKLQNIKINKAMIYQ